MKYPVCVLTIRCIRCWNIIEKRFCRPIWNASCCSIRHELAECTQKKFPDFLRGEIREMTRPFARRGVIGPRRDSKDISLTILGFFNSCIRKINCFFYSHEKTLCDSVSSLFLPIWFSPGGLFLNNSLRKSDSHWTWSALAVIENRIFRHSFG